MPPISIQVPAGLVTLRVIKCIRGMFIAIPMFIGLVGLLFFVWGTNDWISGSASSGWPKATGSVTSSEVVSTTQHRNGHSETVYLPSINYTYSVNGVELRGDKISFRTRFEGETLAQITVARYPIGSNVAVSYDPDDPATSVLEPGADRTNWIPIGFGGFVAVSCAIFTLKSLRTLRRMTTAIEPVDPTKAGNELPGNFS